MQGGRLVMTLDQARALLADPFANRRVGYQSYDEVIPGTIVSVGNQYVFVVYGNSPTAKATAPELLTLLEADS